jgi:hypothetical protein
MSDTGAPLSDGQAEAMEAWVFAANGWAEAAQAVVGASTELATASRELSDRLGPKRPQAADRTSRDDIPSLARSLSLLADAVEDDTRQLRDSYLSTAASLEQYRTLLD